MMNDKRKAVVCKRGHVGDYKIKLDVDYNGEPNCGICGNKFLINCTSCGSYIKGRTQYDHVIDATPFYPDNNCFNCGKSYPWKHIIKFKPNMIFSRIKTSRLKKIYLILGCIVSVIIIITSVIDYVIKYDWITLF